MSQLIPTLLLLVLVLIFFGDNHVRYDTIHNNQKIEKKEIPFLIQAKTLLGDTCYLSMVFSCGMCSSCLAIIGDTFNTVISSFGFDLVKILLKIFLNFFQF